MNFGRLHKVSGEIVFSVSQTHLVLLNIVKNKVLTYITLENSGQVQHSYWNKENLSLTILVKEEGNVKAEVYKCRTLLDSLND